MRGHAGEASELFLRTRLPYWFVVGILFSGFTLWMFSIYSWYVAISFGIEYVFYVYSFLPRYGSIIYTSPHAY